MIRGHEWYWWWSGCYYVNRARADFIVLCVWTDELLLLLLLHRFLLLFPEADAFLVLRGKDRHTPTDTQRAASRIYVVLVNPFIAFVIQ